MNEVEMRTYLAEARELLSELDKIYTRLIRELDRKIEAKRKWGEG